MPQKPLIIAHRTSPSFAPENSLEGVRVSFEQGADGVEVDLRMSLDLRPFLMHDNSMLRMTGWFLPIELTPSSVVRRKLLRSLAPPGAPAGQPAPSHQIPSLEAALDSLPEGKLLAVDVKTPWAIFPLVAAIKRRGLQARTLIWCSSGLVVRYAVRRLPGVEVAYYKDYEDGPNNVAFIGKAARIGAHAVSLYWPGINSDIVAIAHALGLKVYTWHKDFPVTAEKLASGMDGLITDTPAAAREVLDAWRNDELDRS